MASRLGALSRRAAAPRFLLPVRGGGGGPVALGQPPTQPVRLGPYSLTHTHVWPLSFKTKESCFKQESRPCTEGAERPNSSLAQAKTRQNVNNSVELQLVEEDELIWDDGSAQPEPCLDEFNLVSKYQALGYLTGGFAVFGLIGAAAWYNNKPIKQPFAPKEFPYDNLKKELGSR